MKREKMTFTLKKTVIEEFKKITNKKFINRSALVENLIKNWIDENIILNDKK